MNILQALLMEAKHLLPGEWSLGGSDAHPVELTLYRKTPSEEAMPIGVSLTVRAPSEKDAVERMRGMLAVNLVTLLNTRVERPLDVFRNGLRPFGAFCDRGLVCPTANLGRCECLATLHLIAADLLAAAEIPSSDLGPDDTTTPGVAPVFGAS